MVQQTAAVERVRLAVRDLRFGRKRGGLIRDVLRGAQAAGLRGEADGVGQQVLDLLDFFCTAIERLCQRRKRLGSAPSCSRSRLRASASRPISRCPIRFPCGTAGRGGAAPISPRWKLITAAMP